MRTQGIRAKWWAVCLWALPGVSVGAAQSLQPDDRAETFKPAASRAEPTEIFDGSRYVQLDRLSDGRISWNGSVVGVDQHALLWMQPGELPKAQWGVEVISAPSPTLGLIRVRGRTNEDGVDVAMRLQALVGHEGLRAVIPDILIPHRSRDIAVPPSDPLASGQWFYERIGLVDAWRFEDGDPSTEVVVVDNGCDLAHPDLVDSLEAGRDVRDGDDEPSYDPSVLGNEHGTACAGLVAATTDNGLGVAGTCPECAVRCVRLLGADPLTSLSADIAAFEFALETNAAVVSNSWGYDGPFGVPGPLEAAVRNVITEGRDGLGAVVVFAAGNDNANLSSLDLTAIEGVVAVGATNLFDETTPFSNFGADLDVVAPTGTITTDIQGADGGDPGDYTDLFGGTSSSAPVVAGVAALLISAKPDVTGAEVAELLRSTAEQSFFASPDAQGHDDYYGYGIVRPLEALRVLVPEVVGDFQPETEEPADGQDAPSMDDGEAQADPRPDATGEPLPDAGSEAPTAAGDAGCSAAPHRRVGPGAVPPCLALGLWLLYWRRRSSRHHACQANAAPNTVR